MMSRISIQQKVTGDIQAQAVQVSQGINWRKGSYSLLCSL